MPHGNRKGSSFERLICKKLSSWWSVGLGTEDRDDIFWRASQSGGRATQRAKSGKTTFGSYGDITAVDPIGSELIQLFTIELKIGQSHGHPGDVIDFKEDNKCHKWIATMRQAVGSSKAARSYSWLLICKRNFRSAMVYFDSKMIKELEPLHHAVSNLTKCPVYRFRFRATGLGKVDFIGVPLSKFLAHVKPEELKKYVR